MARVVDDYLTRARLDAREYVRGKDEIVKADRDITRAHAEMARSMVGNAGKGNRGGPLAAPTIDTSRYTRGGGGTGAAVAAAMAVAASRAYERPIGPNRPPPPPRIPRLGPTPPGGMPPGTGGVLRAGNHFNVGGIPVSAFQPPRPSFGSQVKGALGALKDEFTESGGTDGLVDGLKRGAGIAGTFAATIGTLTAALLAGTFAASKAAAQMERYENGVKNAEGGNQQVADQEIRRLRVIAKGPGIGIAQSEQAYAGIRNTGLTSGFTERLIREFGNANANNSGSTETFGHIMTAIKQIASKSKLQGDEVLQLNEAGLPIGKYLKQAFGEADPEKLAKAGYTSTQVLEGLVKVLEKGPRAIGGAQNSIDNFFDAITIGVADAGKRINTVLGPLADDATQSMEIASKGGVFASVGESVAEAIKDAIGGLTGGNSTDDILVDIAVSVKTIADILRNVALNIGAVGKGVGAAWDWLNTPLSGKKKPEDGGEYTNFNGSGYSGSVEQYRDILRTQMEIGRKKDEKDKAKSKAEDAAKLAQAPTEDPQVKVFRDIERNTRETAEIARKAWDPGRRIVGGGGIGGVGVTPVELGAMKRGGKSSRMQVAMMNLLEVIMGEISRGDTDGARYSKGY